MVDIILFTQKLLEGILYYESLKQDLFASILKWWR